VPSSVQSEQCEIFLLIFSTDIAYDLLIHLDSDCMQLCVAVGCISTKLHCGP